MNLSVSFDIKIISFSPFRPLLMRVISSGTYILFGTMFVFLHTLGEKSEPSRRDLTMTFTAFVSFDLFNALSCRHNHRPIYELPWNSNSAFLIAIGLSIIGQLLVVYFAPFQKVFRTVPLQFGEISYIVLITSTLLVLDTLRKKLMPDIFTEILRSTTELPPASNKKNEPEPDKIDLTKAHLV